MIRHIRGHPISYLELHKGGFISESILTSFLLPTDCAKVLTRAENWYKLLRAGNTNFLLRGEIWHFRWQWDQSQSIFLD